MTLKKNSIQFYRQIIIVGKKQVQQKLTPAQAWLQNSRNSFWICCCSIRGKSKQKQHSLNTCINTHACTFMGIDMVPLRVGSTPYSSFSSPTLSCRTNAVLASVLVYAQKCLRSRDVNFLQRTALFVGAEDAVPSIHSALSGTQKCLNVHIV